MGRFVYDYYEVPVPADLVDVEDDTARIKELGGHAIDEARERAKLYCMPALWTATHIGKKGWDEVFRVVRKRNRKAV